MDGAGGTEGRGWILLVDDNRMDVELTVDAFAQAHLDNHVEVVRSGQEAIDYLLGRGPFADRARYPMPEIVLLDLKMPVVDGFEVMRQVKSAPRVRRIPIIVLTSSREEGDRAMSYDYGANSYLVKPVSFAGLLDVVGTLRKYWLTLNVAPPLA